jgi:transposase
MGSSHLDNLVVAKDFRAVWRDQPMLLAPDVRDWLPAGHVVWFLLDAVEAIDTSSVQRRARLGAAGRAPYDPDMLLALLIYAYAGGIRSSRKIERRCREDVAFMVISGLCYPDHATIARFRKDHDAAMAELFTAVLRLCGQAGMGALEHVAIDGTKMAADASPSASRDGDGLRALARRLIDEAAKVDEEEDARYGDARGDELPEALREPARRKQILDELVKQAAADADRGRAKARAAKVDKAERALRLADELTAEAVGRATPRRELAARRLAQAEAALVQARARRQAHHDDRLRREAAAGNGLPGTRPVSVEDHCRVRQAKDRVQRWRRRLTERQTASDHATDHASGNRNITDPDSRFMPVKGGFILGYNSQLAVAADHLILAADVVADTGDEHQLTPMLNQLGQAVDTLQQATGNPDLAVGCALFDAGYASDDNLSAPGPDRLIALGKRHKITGAEPPTSPPGHDGTARRKMAWRLSTPDGKALYNKRGATVEPVNGHLKDRRGLRRFSRRGITAARAELHLAALTTNLLRLLAVKGTTALEATH